MPMARSCFCSTHRCAKESSSSKVQVTHNIVIVFKAGERSCKLWSGHQMVICLYSERVDFEENNSWGCFHNAHTCARNPALRSCKWHSNTIFKTSRRVKSHEGAHTHTSCAHGTSTGMYFYHGSTSTRTTYCCYRLGFLLKLKLKKIWPFGSHQRPELVFILWACVCVCSFFVNRRYRAGEKL